MKKIVFCISFFLTIFAFSCKQKESGQILVENKSSYDVDVEFFQNYKSELFTLKPNEGKSCYWEYYHSCIVKKPSLNIITHTENQNKFTITNRAPAYSYKITNGVCETKILCPNKDILSDSSGHAVSEVSLPLGNSEIKSFTKLTTKNLILDKGSSFTVNGAEYYQIDKNGDSYFFYESLGGQLSTKKITIVMTGNEILLSK